MKKPVLILIAVVVLLVLFGPIVFRRYSIPLENNHKAMAVAKRPLVLPWHDNEYGVYAGTTNVFNLWGNAIDGCPMLIYPFADGQRYLCIYDADIIVGVFVVDFAAPRANVSQQFPWPEDRQLRTALNHTATYVVTKTTGSVRLPTIAELQEASNHIAGLTEKEYRQSSFPALDLGLYRGYWPKDKVLLCLATNRSWAWPPP